jgi:asparagine synthase (glutamine-hydrolysing)
MALVACSSVMRTKKNQQTNQSVTSGPAEPRASLLAALERATRETPGDALLLSGGIDSSLLAALGPRMPVITVALEGYASHEKPAANAGCGLCKFREAYPHGCGSDPRYAQEVAEYLKLDWQLVTITEAQALATLAELVVGLRSYDLQLLNDIVIYSGLKCAQERGWHTIWTGDDADFLFAGYTDFNGDEAKWRDHQAKHFHLIESSAVRLGQLLGMDVRDPYLHSAVKEVAYSLALSDNVEWRETEEAGNFYDQFDPQRMALPAKFWGKIPLRALGRGRLPTSVVARPKTHIMFGAATCRLEWALERSLTGEGRARADAALTLNGTLPRCFVNDVHKALYLMYLDLNVAVPEPVDGEARCAWCGSGEIKGEVDGHCWTCGAWPALRRPEEG